MRTAVMALEQPAAGEFRPGSALRTAGFLALVGLAGIVLLGPVIGVISAVFALFCVVFSLLVSLFSVVLTFAIIGLCFWLPLRLLGGGRSAAWREFAFKARHLALSSWHMLAWYWRGTWTLASWLRAKCELYWQPTWNGVRRGAWVCSRFLVEILSGAAVGAMVAWIANEQTMTLGLGLGAGLGGMLGLFSAVLRSESASADDAKSTASLDCRSLPL